LRTGAGQWAESVRGTRLQRISVSNADVARLFSRYATLLEIEGANVFRVRAYQNAARRIEGLGRSVADMVRGGEDLTELEGIGEDLAGKIQAIVRTGRLAVLDELERRMPTALVELTTVPGLGPKRVKALYDALDVRGLEDLERAARGGRIAGLRGFGAKTVERILQAIEARRGAAGRVAWLEAENTVLPLVEQLRSISGVEDAVVAGSLRRGRETVGDVDVLVSATRSSAVMDAFLRYAEVREVVARGPTRSTVRLAGGLQVDLRVVAPASYGAALMYFTGSKAHNIALRSLAAKRGWKLSEYGLFEGRKRLAGRTEDEVYRRLGLEYIAPELRENGGEIEAARAGTLPRLLALGDIRGDLHCHTNETDGADALEAMARAGEDLGYEYLAITDHTRHLRIANGLDPVRLARELRAIDRLNAKLGKLTILKSAEVDILKDGSLDLPDGSLRELDLVVGAIHDHLGLDRERQTERVLRAMDHPAFNVLAHPTGRLLGEREAYALDIERVMRAAADRGCVLEVNAQPKRRDLADSYCKMAKELGVKVALSTDAHSTSQLGYMRLGVFQARRGWLGPDDVLNTRGLAALRKLLKRA
jgi:DNA polymerase (family 10)